MNIFYLTRKGLRAIGFFGLLILGISQVNAQCNCDFTVPLSVEVFDAAAEGVSPGDVICVTAGTRSRLHFRNIVGTAAQPVVIKNCGGQVVINGSGGGGYNVPLRMNGNVHFRVTGTGDPNHFYGFKIGGQSHAAVEAGARSTNFEFDHIELVSSGFAGFMIKTDPDGMGNNVRPNAPNAVNGGFTMYDVKIHDCYVHDMLPDGEGIYMGNSFWQTGHKTTGEYPHNIYDAKIYNNKFERTGREAIQAGCVVEGLEIYNNEIYDYGYNNPDASQNNGIQIGQGSSGRVYNNYIDNRNSIGTRAIYVMGIGDNYVYNNVIVGAGSAAGNPGSTIINSNLKTAPLPGDPGYDTGGYVGGSYFINNTIIDTEGVAEVFSVYGNGAPGNVLYNNLVISSNSNWDGISGGDWTKANNLRFSSTGAAGLANDYSLQSGSAAIDAGTNVSSYGVDVDKAGAARPNGVYDVGAYEYGGQAPANVAPILGTISNQSVVEGASTTVQLSATDADQDNITFTASGFPAFASLLDNGNGTGEVSIVSAVGDAGTYTGLSVTASDGKGGTDVKTFSITVSAAQPSNNAPTLSSIANQVLEEDQVLAVNVSASDADQDVLTFSTSGFPSFVTLLDNGDGSAQVNITPTKGDVGTYSGLSVTVSDGNGGTDSQSFSVTVNAAGGGTGGDPGVGDPGAVVYRINAGGFLETDVDMDWAKDKQNDPSIYYNSNSVNYTTGSSSWGGVNNTNAPDNVFGPYRYDNGATWGDRQHWSFPVANGDYQVRLYFIAVSSSANTDVFDIEIEGSLKVDNYDVFAKVGGDVPVEEVFVVSVSDGNLDINFPLESGKSFVHGIEIFSTTNSAPEINAIAGQSVDENASLSVNLSATDVDGDIVAFTSSNLPVFATLIDNGNNTGSISIEPATGHAGIYNIEVVANDGNGGVASKTFELVVNEVVTGGGNATVLYRVNTGGLLESDTDMDWSADKQNNPSIYFDNSACVNYTTGGHTWNGVNTTNAPDNIFGPYRYDNGASWGDRQHWEFPVGNGDYEVRLYFIAISSAAGTNVFDVVVEGTTVLNDYDVYATSGPDTPVEHSFTAAVNDGYLTIDFPLENGKSFVHGIEILTSSSSQRINKVMALGDEDLVSVYPNPVDDEVTLDLRGLKGVGAEVSLMDTAGKVLKTITSSSNAQQVQINVAALNLATGLYLLKVETDSEVIMKKLIKK